MDDRHSNLFLSLSIHAYTSNSPFVRSYGASVGWAACALEAHRPSQEQEKRWINVEFITDEWEFERRFPALKRSESQIDLCFREFETEDPRTRAGSGRTDIAAALNIPERQLNEMRTAVARCTPDWDIRLSWYMGFRCEPFAFPASRDTPANRPVVAPWVKQLTVKSVELTLVQTCCEPIDTAKATAELLDQYWAAPKKVAYSTTLQT